MLTKDCRRTGFCSYPIRNEFPGSVRRNLWAEYLNSHESPPFPMPAFCYEDQIYQQVRKIPRLYSRGKEIWQELHGNGGEIRCAEVARIGDRNHVEAIVPRIYELGGKLPDSMVDFHNISGCQAAKFPAIPRDIKAMLTTLVEVERCAVRQYAHVCNLIVGKDHQTDDLSSLSSLKRSNMSHGSRSSLVKARPGISCERVGPSRLFKIPGVKNRLIFFFILRYDNLRSKRR